MLNRSEVAKFHEKGLRAAESFKQSSSDLIDVLQWMDRERGYLEFECTSVYQYATEKLKLSEDVACNLIAIARKSNEVPELKASVRSGNVSVSNARKIVSVITKDNQAQWLKLAAESSARVVQKEVARVNPQAAVVESMKYVTASRLELKLGISEELESRFARAKDVLSQMRQCAVTLEDVIDAMSEYFLWHNDPVERAKRSLRRAGKCTDSNAGKHAGEQVGENAGEHVGEHVNSPAGQHVVKNVDEHDGEYVGNGASHPSTTAAENLSVTKRIDDLRFAECDTNAPMQAVSAMHAQSHKRPGLRRRQNFLKASIRHQVNARDEGRCTEIDPASGKRCSNKRWIDVHHIVPVLLGGPDSADNLVTLCATHHRRRHEEQM